MIFLDYSSLDFQITQPSEAPQYVYRASILEDGNVVASNDFELRQDLKLLEMLEGTEKKATESPKDSKEQKEKVETREEGKREEQHIEFGKMIYSRVFSGELGEYFNKSVKEAQENDGELRISLRFDEGVQEIAALPWEYLHNEEEYLVMRKAFCFQGFLLG